MLNIVKNAAAAVKDQPDAAIEVTLTADGAYARLCIADNGPELSDEEIARLGDIGYTTTAGGLGLGIAIVHSPSRPTAARSPTAAGPTSAAAASSAP